MLKVGFVGCGWANQVHMGNLSKMEGVSLVAFHDLDHKKAIALAQQYGGQAFSGDAASMLATASLDALYVAVPPSAHGIEARAALQGTHLFIEKPVALSLEAACEIAKAADKAGVVTSVGYHFRYLAATRKAREILADRRVGMALGYWMGGMPQVGWWRQKALSGGQAVEQTTHIFDLARWLVGEIEEVSAFHAARALQGVPDFDIWDVGSVGLKFENGAVGTIHSTCLLEQGYRVGLDVFCKDFILSLNGNGLSLSQPGKKKELTFSNDPYFDEDRAFIDAIKSGRREGVLSDYQDGVKTLAATLAANRSAEAGRPVRIAEMFAFCS